MPLRVARGREQAHSAVAEEIDGTAERREGVDLGRAEVDGAPVVALIEERAAIALQEAAPDGRVPLAPVGDEGRTRQLRHGADVIEVHVGHDHEADAERIDAERDEAVGDGRAVDLFGDGTVRLLSTPGHTKGHMSVLLRLRSGRELLLAGDAAYTRRAIDEEHVPLFYDDAHRYMRSLREIRRYLELTPSALVICGHDPESWPQVRERYE